MTDIEQKIPPTEYNPYLEAMRWQGFAQDFQAKLKTKELELQDFRQEVSDAVMQAFPNTGLMPDCLGKLIIPKPKPDPLINVAKMLGYYNAAAKHLAGDIRSALDAAGFEIREKNDGHS